MGNKCVDHSWDFIKADTKQYTHCYHSYPAMMIPQVAGRLLDLYGKKAKYLFDPYCGTGTSLVEANIRGINAVGTDINPLARLIAKVKTSIMTTQTLDLYLKDFNEYVFGYKFGINKEATDTPSFSNINYWFKKDVQEKLSIVKKHIEIIANEDIKNFFKVAFSETIREVSLTRKREFKLYRIPKNKIKYYNPDVFEIMECKLLRNKEGLKKYLEKKKNGSECRILDFNTVNSIPEGFISKRSVNIIVTSPPYGDSKTTVAYGQYSRLANQWFDFKEANQVDRNLMGGQKINTFYKFEIRPLDSAINQIKKRDEKRALEVTSFYLDYSKSINNISKIVKKKGFVAYVIGNRRVKGVELPSDKVTKTLFVREGFRHLKTVTRSIPNKRMPLRNSPTNETGVTDTTMHKEYIVVLQKN
ncbi:MAG: DNA modification methylase [bacterium]|nr:MAG: DNA modification methylase [bacterium]